MGWTPAVQSVKIQAHYPRSLPNPVLLLILNKVISCHFSSSQKHKSDSQTSDRYPQIKYCWFSCPKQFKNLIPLPPSTFLPSWPFWCILHTDAGLFFSKDKMSFFLKAKTRWSEIFDSLQPNGHTSTPGIQNLLWTAPNFFVQPHLHISYSLDTLKNVPFLKDRFRK